MEPQPQTPKALVIAFTSKLFVPLVCTITKYVQEPGKKHLTEHIPDFFTTLTSFEERLKTITTMNQLKDFERIFFRFICTINDQRVIALWNESIECMSKFVISYRNEERRFHQNAFNAPRYHLFCKLLETMMSVHVSEDVRGELTQLYSDFGFTAPEFDERMKEHIHTLDVLIKTKCADTELAVLYSEFCQQIVSLKSEYDKGF